MWNTWTSISFQVAQFHSQVSIFSLFLYFFICILNIKYSSCEKDKKKGTLHLPSEL